MMNRKRVMKIADYYGRLALGLLIVGLAPVTIGTSISLLQCSDAIQ